MPGSIIDRRKNPNSKSISDRQRFIKRVSDKLKKAVDKKLTGDYKINEDGGVEISVPADGIAEPRFTHDGKSGEYDIILPGNKDYLPQDLIGKPPPRGGGRGREGSEDGSGEDEFSFVLSKDEFLDIVFSELELPDLLKQAVVNIEAFSMKRAGHTTAGAPTNLNIQKTAIAGLSRRMALLAPKVSEIEELEEELKTADKARAEEIELLISELRRKSLAISYLDDVDLRFNNFVKQPKPITQAVMVIIMDVSFSMGKREKLIAKKFFILLKLFLDRTYKNIDIVFIRHHTEASECDEETFFTSKEGGGTLVSTSYELALKVIRERYSPDAWNIYVAQASDGDNAYSDMDESRMLLKELLPLAQFMVYTEIISEMSHQHMFGFTVFEQGENETNMWQMMTPIEKKFNNLAMAKINNESSVVSVFRKLFAKREAK